MGPGVLIIGFEDIAAVLIKLGVPITGFGGTITTKSSSILPGNEQTSLTIKGWTMLYRAVLDNHAIPQS